jgi:hypothetical protein
MSPRQDWTEFNLAAHRATKESPAGERHLIGVVERGDHGVAVATVALVNATPGGWRCESYERLSCEAFPEARAFVSAWIWYRVANAETRP